MFDAPGLGGICGQTRGRFAEIAKPHHAKLLLPNIVAYGKPFHVVCDDVVLQARGDAELKVERNRGAVAQAIERLTGEKMQTGRQDVNLVSESAHE